MKYNKFLNISLALVMLLSIFAFTVDAESRIVAVYDEANLLSSSEEQKLEDLAEEYSDNIDINVIFVTTNDADGKTTEAYADDYYDDLTSDQLEYSGILFLIDMDNREITISTAGNCITWFNDNEIEVALDKGYNYIVDEKYYKTLDAMAKYSLKTIEHWYESGDTPEDDYLYSDDNSNDYSYDDDYSYDEPSKFDEILSNIGQNMFYSLIITIIVVIILTTKHNSANKKVSAVNYIDKTGKGYKVINRDRHHVRTYETVSKNYYKESSSSSSRSGGGHRSGSSHSSSSGRSHGGGSRKF